MVEGYVKYRCEWQKAEPPEENLISDINSIRTELYKMGLVGCLPDSTGYGNVSKRIYSSNEFIISGTQTGHIELLKPEHYSRVTEFNITTNHIVCHGMIEASSEALTHGAVYLSNSEAKAVLHIHTNRLWKSLLYKIPTTPEFAEYGTPELAEEIGRLMETTDLPEKKILAMAGHPDGIISFGGSPKEAFEKILYYAEM